MDWIIFFSASVTVDLLWCDILYLLSAAVCIHGPQQHQYLHHGLICDKPWIPYVVVDLRCIADRARGGVGRLCKRTMKLWFAACRRRHWQ